VKHIIWILSLMLILSSCSTLKQNATPTTTTPPTKSAKNIHRFHLSGKIAVHTSHDSGSASIDWSENQHQYTIALQGPLGAGAMKLIGQPGQVTLKASDGKTYQAASAEELLAKQWGFHLPVSNMKDWIRGLPVSGVTANIRYDEVGRITSMIQQGYRIDYLAYSTVNGIALPEKMTIVSPTLNVKMVVYRWDIV